MMKTTRTQTMARFSSASDEWATPREVYEDLNREFDFDFDPCPLGGSEDGSAPLFVSWRGRRIFCNPPYSNIRAFLERAHEAEVAVFLIPSRTDVRWFHDIVLPEAKEIRFIRGRVQFGGRVKDNAPFPSMIVIFENNG